MHDQLAKFAYNGQWMDLLDLLRRQPELTNIASKGKGYTPLHQAAWHGADLSIIGALLFVGADRRLVTSEGKTPYDIAQARHPDREDLRYLLAPSTRTLSQLLRKLVAENLDFFEDYDGNRLLCDRLITSLGETWTTSTLSENSHAASYDTPVLDARMNAAFHAITGASLPSHGTAHFKLSESFNFEASLDFMRGTLLPPLRTLTAQAHLLPLEPHWTVLSDLFEPAPEQWGLRGDLFLWMELRQALCHCDLPEHTASGWEETIQTRLETAITTLIGTAPQTERNIAVQRFERGGMSEGMVCCSLWHRRLIPLLVERAGWLRQSWSRLDWMRRA